jgi:enoyl-CoA hydratase
MTAMESSTAEDVLYREADGIGIITFNRPAARNALTFAMYDKLAEICQAVAAQRTVGALVLMGAGGRAFAAGTDISSFRDIREAADALAYEQRINEVLDTVECCPVPTIAALAGACTGGGAAIAAACDLRLATRDLKFGFPIARTLGNCLSTASLARLVALIGAGRTREILFTARLIGAEDHQPPPPPPPPPPPDEPPPPEPDEVGMEAATLLRERRHHGGRGAPQAAARPIAVVPCSGGRPSAHRGPA